MKVSILNLIPRFEEETVAQAIDRATKLAQVAEKLGFERYWMAEHHNFKGVVSSASELIVQHILQHTQTIRVGAGGVMLPNHIPLQIAERYGTLECLYPKRVDLGVGRAPRTDYNTAQVIARDNDASVSGYLKTVDEIRSYLGFNKEQKVIAYPGENTNVPIYILGSTTSSAYVAAKLGLPYSFATHFAPSLAQEAIEIYRNNFIPSKQLKEPYVILGIVALLTNKMEEAVELYNENYQSRVDLIQSLNSQLISDDISSAEKIIAQTFKGLSLIGTKESVQEKWQELKKMYQPDEVIAVSHLSSLEQLETSYRLLKEVVQL